MRRPSKESVRKYARKGAFATKVILGGAAAGGVAFYIFARGMDASGAPPTAKAVINVAVVGGIGGALATMAAIAVVGTKGAAVGVVGLLGLSAFSIISAKAREAEWRSRAAAGAVGVAQPMLVQP